MTTTPNLGLVKASPASPDPLSTRVDGNLDLIDAAVGALQAGGGGSSHGPVNAIQTSDGAGGLVDGSPFTVDQTLLGIPMILAHVDDAGIALLSVDDSAVGTFGIASGSPSLAIRLTNSSKVIEASLTNGLSLIGLPIFVGALNSGPAIYSGAGNPNGVVTADIGSLYLRSDGGPGTTLYVKETAGGNTVWAGK
jgi:hypothetical protein